MQTDLLVLDDRTFARIARLMYDTIGISLGIEKKSLVMSRLAPHIKRLGLGGFAEYANIIEDESEGAEFQVAVDLLTTHETYFFREPQHFDLLEKEILAQRQPHPIKAWSAACSFGDEAYSMAMLLSDLQIRGQCMPGWSVVATDISQRVLLTAKQGIYPADRFRLVSSERLKKYCLKGEGPAEGQIMVQPRLRNCVSFGQLNLTQAFTGLDVFDVVMLRNVLIYFDLPTRQAVVDRVLECLRPGGLFFVGTSEGRVQAGDRLQLVATGVFRKMR